MHIFTKLGLFYTTKGNEVLKEGASIIRDWVDEWKEERRPHNKKGGKNMGWLESMMDAYESGEIYGDFNDVISFTAP